MIEHLTTTMELEEEGLPPVLITNVWFVGDDDEVLVIDPANDAPAILDVIGKRRVVAIACTQGSIDHVNAAVDVADACGAPVLLHAIDRHHWDDLFPDRAPDGELEDGQVFTAGSDEVHVMHTPGFTRGSCSFHVPGQASLISGDILFPFGPAPVSFPGEARDESIKVIRERFFALPDDTAVLPGHGDPTTIGAQREMSPTWET